MALVVALSLMSAALAASWAVAAKDANVLEARNTCRITPRDC